MEISATENKRSCGMRYYAWIIMVIVVFSLVAGYSYIQPGPYNKDMQMIAWVQANSYLGLSNTKGYNVSAHWVNTRVERPDGLQVYVSAPAGGTLVSTLFYVISGHEWRSIRLVSVMFLGLMLAAVFFLFKRWYYGKIPSFSILLVLVPMILVHLNVIDNYVWTGGLALLSYYFFEKYLDSRRKIFIVLFGVTFLLSFAISYISVSILPAIFIHLIYLRFRNEVSWREIAEYVFAVVIAITLVLSHPAIFPGALSALKLRGLERSSWSMPGGDNISLIKFFMRQAARCLTYFTPVSIGLALLGLWDIGVKLQKGISLANYEKAVLHMATWGVPFGIMMIQVAYIHPYMMFYFTPLFVFGSMKGFESLMSRMSQNKLKMGIAVSLIVLFTVFSVGRSMLRLSGEDMFGKAAGMKTVYPTEPDAKDYLRRYSPDTVIPQHYWQWPPEDLRKGGDVLSKDQQ